MSFETPFEMSPEVNIVISAGNSLCKWLKIDPPRLPSPDGKRIGTQSLQNTQTNQHWQCQAIQQRGNPYTLVIAVEAQSRFSIILPFARVPSQDEFEEEFLAHMMKKLIGLLLHHGIVNPDDPQFAIDRILGSVNDMQWFHNTDLSVNGHVKDTEEWLYAFQDHYNKKEINAADVAELEDHVNDMVKKVKNGKSKDSFIPVPQFIDDAIERFDIFGRQAGESDANQLKTGELPDNVVSMADYRK